VEFAHFHGISTFSQNVVEFGTDPYNEHGQLEITECKCSFCKGAYLGEKWCDEDKEDIIEKEKTKQHCT